MVQEGESAPARVMPLLDSIREDLQTDGCPRPLQTVITNLQYPTSHLQPHLPQMYQVSPVTSPSAQGLMDGAGSPVAALRGSLQRVQGATPLDLAWKLLGWQRQCKGCWHAILRA